MLLLHFAALAFATTKSEIILQKCFHCRLWHAELSGSLFCWLSRKNLIHLSFIDSSFNGTFFLTNARTLIAQIRTVIVGSLPHSSGISFTLWLQTSILGTESHTCLSALETPFCTTSTLELLIARTGNSCGGIFKLYRIVYLAAFSFHPCASYFLNILRYIYLHFLCFGVQYEEKEAVNKNKERG